MAAAMAKRFKLFSQLTGSSGEPLVLVHGSWVDHHNWDLVVPKLARSFRVLTYDRRGHGRSGRPGGPGSIRENAADLAALIEGFGLAPAHVAGTSLGGSIVLRLACERPDLFHSLIVNEPPLMSLLSGQWAAAAEEVGARVARVLKQLEAGDMEGGARQFVETIAFGPGAWERIPESTRKTAVFNAPTFLDEMHDPEVFAIDLARLRTFPRPALLTRGENGPPFFRPIVERLAAALPRAELNIFAGAGHEPEQTHPEAYAAALAGFIESTARCGAEGIG